MELVLVVSVIMYLAPSIIGFMRGHASKWAILAMNLFLGWSVLFWFWSLFWSLSNKGGNQTVIVNNQINNK
ncbi:superinfection immunity protein [Escherichia coli]|uniref:superinfection immunity protein n=1 Tax=Escherichia coli TaxID=562 RepID=UPI001F1D9F95|nr:superinfection immunity protein [Escherichia coli]